MQISHLLNGTLLHSPLIISIQHLHCHVVMGPIDFWAAPMRPSPMNCHRCLILRDDYYWFAKNVNMTDHIIHLSRTPTEIDTAKRMIKFRREWGFILEKKKKKGGGGERERRCKLGNYEIAMVRPPKKNLRQKIQPITSSNRIFYVYWLWKFLTLNSMELNSCLKGVWENAELKGNTLVVDGRFQGWFVFDGSVLNFLCRGSILSTSRN